MVTARSAHPLSGNERLRQFLRTYSSVPNAFIDDLFDMVGETTSQTDIVIDGMLAATIALMGGM